MGFLGRVTMLSQQWGRLASVCYANIQAEQRNCPYCMFVQMWVLGDNATELAPGLAELQGLHARMKTRKLLIMFCLVHRAIHSSERYIPSFFSYAFSQAGGVQPSRF